MPGMGLKVPPLPLKLLLIALGIGGIVSGVLFRFIAPYLALSLPAIEHGWVWTLLSYAFVLSAPIGWGAMLDLAFNLFMIWLFGSAIIDHKGMKSFLILFFGATLFAGLAGLIGMIGVPFFLFGPTPALFAILIAWMMLNKDAQVWFLISMKAAWAIGAIIAIDLLIHLSRGAWIPLLANGGGALFGYLYFKAPALKRHKERIYHPSKIYDIQSGRPILDDDQFMDAMLARISLYGEDSLTPEEKKRMKQISEHKAPPKPIH